ncbi:MAG: hypothetical protein ACTSW1_12640 [Candidatus Hodarchaeales archaeon]
MSTVYSPREDTWFMTEVIINFLKVKTLENSYPTVCEVGVGSGYILKSIGKFFPNFSLIGIDISLESIRTCLINLKTLSNLALICTDLLSCFNTRKFQPEVIYFNPPYVRTALEEVDPKNIQTLSYAGGPGGIIVIDRFLEGIKQINFQTAFFISSNWNDNSLIFNKYRDVFYFDVVSQKRLPDEKLICFKVTR